ncbi:rhodanese-like domain-containing protein [Actinokineospora sp. UTMC 2448]|uniref:MBL fold metallo-hydrolase n=1 Tax=Actinokineospora sp. UTMC 2448 TaxID=2268449 RepID=UPI0021641484|nr:MBL fold metallo-hydrolase [Actinokineospora sp. UTMC 2448]UVS80237.1 putative polyketide biosynthesis zinc-dependent hydrolase BaeB [Actinokineospora sp. UTMC 2448]
MGLSVEVVETTELGDRSYVAHDGAVAVVVDPQRDIDRVEAVLARHGLRCVLVVETHIHNDYVTGGHELARRTGAAYLVAAGDDVSFDRDAVSDGDVRTAGSLTVRVVATPGHTDHHLSYVVSRGAESAVFTGGSLLFGGVGRTDLVDPDRTEELARAQFRSARRLAAELGDDVPVYPTHGFGSFCSSGSAAAGASSTIGDERRRNDALVEQDEDAFVTKLVAGLTAYPSYYAHMSALNRQGPGAPDLSPPEPVDPDELRRRIRAGEWVVDLRDRTAYAAEHVGGTISIALGDRFSTYLGWLIPWGSPLTLIGETADQVADAQRQLVRIGVDRIAGAAVGAPSELAKPEEVRTYPTATFADLARARADAGVHVIDVRREDERAAGHVPGSTHIPLHSLLDRLGEVPRGRLWVHCAAGTRAAIAASLLARAGHDVVLVDDDFAANSHRFG